MDENLKANCPSTTSRFYGIKVSVPVVAVFLFLFNLFGYIAFRYSIADDIFGGDTVNAVMSRMDSYILKQSNLIGDPSLLYSMILEGRNKDPKDDINSLVYHSLSSEGQKVLERLIKDPTNEQDREIFLLEMNRSILEKNIKWPVPLLKASLKDPEQAVAGKLNYNLQVLSWFYPNNIQDCISPEFQWKYDLSSLVKSLPKVASAYFTINIPTRYSPLTNIYTTIVQMYMQNSPERAIYTIVLTGLIYATLVLVVFLLALKFIESIPWALVAVFLFQSSVSTLISSYQLFSLPYLLVPLVMGGALYAYLQYKDSGKVGWLILFFCLSMMGPWFREFPGAIPFVAFASEVLSFRGRRSVIILLLCLPLMLHSLYPSLFPWLIGLNKGGVYYVFSQENVQHITNPKLNWHFGGLLFVQFPPTLWIITLVAIGYWLWRTCYIQQVKRIELSFFNQPISFNLPSFVIDKTRLRLLPILLLIALTCYFGYSFFIANKARELYGNIKHGLPLPVLIASVALASFRFNSFLPVYFLAAFVPFLRITLAEMHLSFTLIPLAIIFSLWIRDLFFAIATNFEERKKRVALLLLSGLFGIGLIDQFLNIPACYWSANSMVKANKAMATWLKDNTPRHSIVVCNFYNFTDVFYYSNYHFAPYETVENCPMGPTQVVHKYEDFKKLLDRNFGVRDVYLLAADHPFFLWQKDYHSHKYVRKPPGEIEKLAEFSARSIYYYGDPIKYFVPRCFVSFVGYMDWSTDYYYNNESSMFKRIVYADYTLYKLKDISKGFTEEEPPPVLVGAHKGFNIINYNKLFYGVAQSMWPLDLALEENRNRQGIFVGRNKKEVKRLIEAHLEKGSSG